MTKANRSASRRYNSYRPSSATLSISARKARQHGQGGGGQNGDVAKDTADAVRDLLQSIASPPAGGVAREEEKKDGNEMFGFQGAKKTLTVNKVNRIYGPTHGSRIVPYGTTGAGIGGSMAPPPPRTPAAAAGGAAGASKSILHAGPGHAHSGAHHVQFTTPAPSTSAHHHLPSHKTPYPGRGTDIVAPTSPAAAHGADKRTGAVPDGHVHFQFNSQQTTELSVGKHDLKGKSERLPHDAYPGRGEDGAVKKILPAHSQPLQTPKTKGTDGGSGSGSGGAVRYVGPPNTPRDPKTGEVQSTSSGTKYGYSFTPSKPVQADEITDAVLAEVAIERSGVDAAAPSAAGTKKVDWDFDGDMLSPSQYRKKHKMGKVEKKAKKVVKGTPHPKKAGGGHGKSGGLPYASPAASAPSGCSGGSTLDKARRTAAAQQKATAAPAPATPAPGPPPSSGGDVSKKYTGSWGNLFSLKPGQWRCDACRTMNEASDKTKCRSCEMAKPGAEGGDDGGDDGKSSAAAPAPAATIGAGGFAFGAPAPVPALDTPAAAPAPGAIGTGGFSFGAPAPAPAAKESDAAPAPAPAGGFSFGAPAPAPAGADSAAPAPAAGGFSFGTTSAAPAPADADSKKDDADKKSNETKPAPGGFSFGTAAAPAPAPAASGGFSFGTAAPPAKKEEAKKDDSTADEWKCNKCGASNAAGIIKCLMCQADKDESGDATKKKKKPASTFGGFGATTSAPAPAPTAGGFSFGSTAPAPAASTDEKKDEAPKPAFSFGAAAPAPAPAAPDDKKEEAPKPAFSFGTSAPAPAAEPKKDEAPKPTFTFGGSSAPAPAPAAAGFGAPSAPAPAPAAGFSFGSSAPVDDGRLKDDRNPKKKRSAGGDSAAPAFTFGGAAPSAPTLPPATGGFGAAPPAAAPPAPAFAFGSAAPPSAPTPPPLASAAVNPPAPAFAFGSAAAPAPAPAGGAAFAFGSANAAAPPPAPQPFGFGAAAPTPPPPASQPGSQSTSPVPPAFGFGAAAAPPQQPAPGGFGAPAAGGFGAPAPPAPGGFGAPPAQPGAPAFGGAAAPAGAGGFSIGTGGSSNQGGKQRRRIVRARRPPR